VETTGEAPVGAAEFGLVAGAARDRVVARQLLVPEQDLAQHHLGRGLRILGRDERRVELRQQVRGEGQRGEQGT
jgi:hypothetical protein